MIPGINTEIIIAGPGEAGDDSSNDENAGSDDCPDTESSGSEKTDFPLNPALSGVIAIPLCGLRVPVRLS